MNLLSSMSVSERWIFATGILLIAFCLGVYLKKFKDWYKWNYHLTEKERKEIIKRREYKNFLLSANPADLTDDQLKHKESFLKEDLVEAQKDLANLHYERFAVSKKRWNKNSYFNSKSSRSI